MKTFYNRHNMAPLPSVSPYATTPLLQNNNPSSMSKCFVTSLCVPMAVKMCPPSELLLLNTRPVSLIDMLVIAVNAYPAAGGGVTSTPGSAFRPVAGNGSSENCTKNELSNSDSNNETRSNAGAYHLRYLRK